MSKGRIDKKDKMKAINVTIEIRHLKLLKKGKTVSAELRRILDLYIEQTNNKS